MHPCRRQGCKGAKGCTLLRRDCTLCTHCPLYCRRQDKGRVAMTVFRPRHLSVSSVQLYLRCPAQYRARYVDGLVTPTTQPQAWGQAFHKALEALHRGEDAELAWIAAWNGCADNFRAAGQPFGPGKLHGLALLEAYRGQGLHGVKGEPEQKFILPFPSPKIPVPLLGYIDLVVPTERHFRDFKTSASHGWNETKVALEPQLHTYGWAYQKLYHHRAERALWVVFSTQRVAVDVYEAVPSPDGFRLFEQTAEAVWSGIVQQRFEGCGTCSLCRPKSAVVDGNAPAFVWEEPG